MECLGKDDAIEFSGRNLWYIGNIADVCSPCVALVDVQDITLQDFLATVLYGILVISYFEDLSSYVLLIILKKSFDIKPVDCAAAIKPEICAERRKPIEVSRLYPARSRRIFF